MAIRVLLLTQVLPYPPDSGPKVRTWNLLKCMARAAEVTLVSFVRGDQRAAAERLRDHCRAVHTVPMRRGRLRDGVHLARSLLMHRPFLMVRDDRAAMRRLVARVARTTRFDIVQADQLNMAQYAARVPGARRILDAHNALWLLYRRLCAVMPAGVRRMLLGREWRLLRRYEARMCGAFDAVLAVTAEDERALRDAAATPLPISVVPICVDTEEVVPLPRRPTARLVYVGTMYWEPNADAVRWLVREVLPRIRARRPEVGLDVIGSRPPRDLRALGGSSPHLNVLGYVEDPSAYLARAGVFVAPLRAGGGMRVKILQALAQGLPVVTTTLGCEGMAVEPGRDLLVADTPEAFAAATLRLLADPVLAETLGRNGRRLIEARYDWRAVCPRLHAVYRDLGGAVR